MIFFSGRSDPSEGEGEIISLQKLILPEIYFMHSPCTIHAFEWAFLCLCLIGFQVIKFRSNTVENSVVVRLIHADESGIFVSDSRS